MPCLNITFAKGRTVEQKRAMVEKVTKALVETINCKQDDVRIFITEVTPDQVGIAGKLSADKT